jgi:putative transposase
MSDTEKVVAGQESETAWRELLWSLVTRHLRLPTLTVIDGNPGLQAALRAVPRISIQRCINHKLRNLPAKASAHLREEVAEDYRRTVYVETREGVAQARVSFVRKWQLRCKAVVSSFEEDGDELFTFLQFPQSQSTNLRTTNPLERINERGISPPHQDPGPTAGHGRCIVIPIWAVAQRPDCAALQRWPQ